MPLIPSAIISDFVTDIGVGSATPVTPKELVSDAVKRSTIAHLFHFYPVLCEIATIPRKSPSGWVLPDRDSSDTSRGVPDSKVESKEVNARDLAGECLKEVGREMGVSL